MNVELTKREAKELALFAVWSEDGHPATNRYIKSAVRKISAALGGGLIAADIERLLFTVRRMRKTSALTAGRCQARRGSPPAWPQKWGVSVTPDGETYEQRNRLQ